MSSEVSAASVSSARRHLLLGACLLAAGCSPPPDQAREQIVFADATGFGQGGRNTTADIVDVGVPGQTRTGPWPSRSPSPSPAGTTSEGRRSTTPPTGTTAGSTRTCPPRSSSQPRVPAGKPGPRRRHPATPAAAAAGPDQR